MAITWLRRCSQACPAPGCSFSCPSPTSVLKPITRKACEQGRRAKLRPDRRDTDMIPRGCTPEPEEQEVAAGQRRRPSTGYPATCLRWSSVRDPPWCLRVLDRLPSLLGSGRHVCLQVLALGSCCRRHVPLHATRVCQGGPMLQTCLGHVRVEDLSNVTPCTAFQCLLRTFVRSWQCRSYDFKGFLWLSRRNNSS